MNGSDSPRIWIEVDDLIRYFDGSLTPTGIARVQMQILACLASHHADRVSFCRFGASERDIAVLEYADITRLTDGDAVLAHAGRSAGLLPVRRGARFLARRLGAALDGFSRSRRTGHFAQAVRPDDMLLTLGASWTHRHFARTAAALKRTHGLRVGALVHDVLPLSHPDYCNPRDIPEFASWFAAMAPVWDMVMTPSRATASALAGRLGALRQTMPPITVVPFGAGFGTASPAGSDLAPAERHHVLYVSTIEIRKNHMLLVKVWQRLIAMHGTERVPDLVFAGKLGWEIAGLLEVLKETRFLGGKVRIVANLSDAALAALYRSALFTVFPSFCEGWGLPVSESLFFGRHCIASDATSIPEVGGGFVQYHDPRDTDAAFRLIEAAILDRQKLAVREEHLRDAWRPPRWETTADAIVAAVDARGASMPVPARTGPQVLPAGGRGP